MLPRSFEYGPHSAIERPYGRRPSTESPTAALSDRGRPWLHRRKVRQPDVTHDARRRRGGPRLEPRPADVHGRGPTDPGIQGGTGAESSRQSVTRGSNSCSVGVTRQLGSRRAAQEGTGFDLANTGPSYPRDGGWRQRSRLEDRGDRCPTRLLESGHVVGGCGQDDPGPHRQARGENRPELGRELRF
jgi:hypothetical protein